MHDQPSTNSIRIEAGAEERGVVACGEARVCGTSVSRSAARTRYSRSMVSLRPSGTLRGGRRNAIRAPPRLISKISLEAPPLMKRASNGWPEPGRFRSSIQRARLSMSMSPASFVFAHLCLFWLGCRSPWRIIGTPL